MLRTVGSDSSLRAAGQVNQAGGVASGDGRALQDGYCRPVSGADLSISKQAGYFDRTDSLQRLGLAPAADEGVRVHLLVPSRSLGDFDTAVEGLAATGFSMPLQQPITLDQHHQLNSLIGLNAIGRQQSVEVLKQSTELGLARRASQPALYSQGSGANRSSANLRESSGATSSQAQAAHPAAARVPRSKSAAGLAPAPRSGASIAAASSGDRAPLSTSVAPTDQDRTAGALNVEQGNGGVNPHEERRSPWARFKGSDYFPQRKLAYVFLGALGFTGWWAGEVMKAATVKLQDPNQPRALIVTQMLAPFIVFAVVMRVYLQMNKEKKQDDEFAVMKNQITTLAAGRDLLREEPAARTAGPHNV